MKAAKELADRLEKALGPAVRARLTVANFHSFCHRILVESAPDAGLPSTPDVLDGVGQVLLLRDIRPVLPLLYYSGKGSPNWWLDRFVGFINRAKDELVSPDDFDAFVGTERRAFEERFGPYERALERLEALGAFDRGRWDTHGAYATFRGAERAADAGDPAADPEFHDVEKIADREARRAVWGTGGAVPMGRLADEQRERAEHLAASYVADGAALEVLRLTELAIVYRAYEAERERRGALDFGEQVAAVIRLFRERPNVLRRWQRRFRYLLVDEFQDANVAQIELVEMLGRTPDRPDNVMVVGDDDQSIYRFRGASYAAFVEFDARFAGPPAHDPEAPAPGTPTRMRIEQNFRSRPQILVVANRLICCNELRYEPDKRLAPHRDGEGAPAVELLTCAGPGRRGGRDRRADQGAGRLGSRDGRPAGRPVELVRGPLPQAQAPRGDRRPAARGEHPLHRVGWALALRRARDPRPRAGAPDAGRPVRRRRPGPRPDRGPVAPRRARAPGDHPGGEAGRAPPP